MTIPIPRTLIHALVVGVYYFQTIYCFLWHRLTESCGYEILDLIGSEVGAGLIVLGLTGNFCPLFESLILEHVRRIKKDIGFFGQEAWHKSYLKN